ncbi:hypothetical protein [Limnohabitans sp.]
MQGDIHDPATWHLLMLQAIAGLQAGDKFPARTYLQFVQQHRGRQVSEETKHRLLRLAQTKAFANAHQLVQEATRDGKAAKPATPPASLRAPPRKQTRR